MQEVIRFDCKIKLALLVIYILLSSNTTIFAQQHDFDCGTEFPGQEWEDRFQDLISSYKSSTQYKSTQQSNTIPVIFHIIHGGEAIGIYPNLKQEQIQSQIDVLNQDFNYNSYNINNYPVNAFKNWAINQSLPAANLDDLGRVKIANLNISFCLATTDEHGNTMAEPGIERINYLDKGWPAPINYTTQATFKNYLDNILKPSSIWDVTKYMNIWITDKSPALTNGGVSSVPPLSGIADIPNSATDSTDGIWCYAKMTGSYPLFPSGTYLSSNIDGRTLTHEAGHYFGLRHIWGDTECGNDFCNDTPPAAGQNGGAPDYPHHAGSCSSPSNSPDGEMFMNFMDYTMGPSKYMFTVDQMSRVHTALLNSPFRNQLGTHGICSVLSSVHPPQAKPPKINISTTDSQVWVEIPDQTIREIEIYSVSGMTVHRYHAPTFNLSDLPRGIYFLSIKTDNNIYNSKLAFNN